MSIRAFQGVCMHCGHDHDAANEEFQRALAARSMPSATRANSMREALRRLLACINDHKGHGLPTIRDRAECYLAMSEAETALGWALADEVNAASSTERTIPYPDYDSVPELDVDARMDEIRRSYRGLGDGTWACAGWYAKQLVNEIARLRSTPNAEGDKPTEQMADAVRGITQIVRCSPGITFPEVYQHCALRGDDMSRWPQWARDEEGYVTEMGLACLIYEVMQAARSHETSTAPTVEALGERAKRYERMGDALLEMMAAYERRIRSECSTPEQLAQEPWRCAEFVMAEEALRGT